MHRWERDYHRAARPPPDVIQGAKDTLIAWILLFFFACVLGGICMLFDVGHHHH